MTESVDAWRLMLEMASLTLPLLLFTNKETENQREGMVPQGYIAIRNFRKTQGSNILFITLSRAYVISKTMCRKCMRVTKFRKKADQPAQHG